MVATRTKKLGQILVEAHKVTEEQLDLALREQRQTGEKLGSIFQRLGICTEKDIARVLAGQAGVAYVNLEEEWIAREAVDTLPSEFAEKHILIPVSLRANTLVVAMANPLELLTTTLSRCQYLRAWPCVLSSLMISASLSSLVVIMPPSPVVMFLVA